MLLVFLSGFDHPTGSDDDTPETVRRIGPWGDRDACVWVRVWERRAVDDWIIMVHQVGGRHQTKLNTTRVGTEFEVKARGGLARIRAGSQR